MPPDLLTVANGAVQSEASANGIVLERVGGVVTMCDRPPPGGEPLWRISRRPRTFVPSRIWPNRGAAGGSRERPSAPQLYGPDVNESKSQG